MKVERPHANLFYPVLFLLLFVEEIYGEMGHGTMTEAITRMIDPMMTGAIVGDDDRREWYEQADPKLKALGRSTAVMIQKKENLLEKTADGYRLSPKTKTFREADELCPGEKYADQLSPGFCSSFLVSADVVATARHCVVDSCKGLHFVFDFLNKTQGSSKTSFDDSDVYECDRIVDSDETADWALIKLNRSVEGRPPFAVRKAGEPKVGTDLTLLGYPRGLPLKIASGTKVVENQNSDTANYFEAHLDGFGGNSGSAVINSETLEVEGIYTVGFGEFEETTDSSGKPCKRLKRYANEQESTAGWISRASKFRQAVAKLPH